MDVIQKLSAQLLAVWRGASTSGRIVTVGAVTITLVTVVGAAIWSSRPDYKPLREGISPVLTAEIVSVLDSSGIPNRMNYSGTGVMVPTSRWNAANVAIASLGIPDDTTSSSAPGTNLFPTKTGHGDQVRAREVSLERGLEALRAVRSADVHLAIPEKSPFRRDRQPATASVIVEPQANQIISSEMAQSIIHTVASAVEGLDPKNVTLANADGSLLGNAADQDPATRRLQYVRNLEAEYAMKAQDLLAAVLGPSQAVIRVSAKVDDFLDKVTTRNQIDSAGKVRLEEKIETSDQKGLSSVAAGVAGASSNSAGGYAPSTAAQPVSGKSETTETSYDYPKTTEKTHKIGGQLLALSISATVDVTPNDSSNDGTPASPLLTQEQVEGIIKSAVGFDEVRGDQIQVVLTEFSSDPTAALAFAVPETQKWEFVSQLARNASLGLAAMAALLIATMTLKRVKPIQIQSGENNQRRRELLSELSSRVDENPEAVSRILAAWLGNASDADMSSGTGPMKKAA